jgi:hypothetical protein
VQVTAAQRVKATRSLLAMLLAVVLIAAVVTLLALAGAFAGGTEVSPNVAPEPWMYF